MRTRIKVCGITTRDALDACLDAGVDAVGFVFAESPRRLEPRAARGLIEHVPGLVASVGVFRGSLPEEIEAATLESGVAIIQADAAELVGIRSKLRTLPVYRTGGSSALGTDSTAPLILIEGPQSGTGTRCDWGAITALARKRRIVLAGGLTPANVEEAIRTVRPFAVDVSSGVESSRGMKDVHLIREFVEAVRRADRSIGGGAA